MRSPFIVAAALGITVALTATPAAAETVGAAPPARPIAARAAIALRDATDDVRVARDISFPQCGGPFPTVSSGSVGVLGTNDGASFTTNPCLVNELAWAKRHPGAPAFYTNTGDPGPSRSTHWPTGQTSPELCRATDPNSSACSYDYGWNAGWQSFAVAADAARRLHHVGLEAARRRAANVDWWLDVETMNSWLTDHGSATAAAQQGDTASLLGEYAALVSAGVQQVGIYSTAFQWQIITGDTRTGNAQFGPTAQWLAGYSSKATATAGCAAVGFMPGPVRMTQYLAPDGFDADVICGAADLGGM